MLETPKRDRQAERREATRAEILEQAWALCREHGLTGLSLRELAGRIGLKAPSLYSYVDSKHALYDAMFAQGCEEFDAMQQAVEDELGVLGGGTEDLVAAVGRRLRAFVDFCAADEVRYQLLFQRTIPGFEPSAATYALSQAALGRLTVQLDAVGLGGSENVDLMTALASGLAAQQIANDPGGDRWARLADEAGAMFVAHARSRAATPPPGGPGTAREQDR